jgi:sulfotransferase family protein
LEEDSLSNRVRAHVNAVYTRLFVTPRYRRQFHAFCVGTEKSGTHSVAALTARSYRSDHEPDYPWLIPRLTESRFDRPEEWDTYLRQRDRRLWLEMESNWLHIFEIEQLVRVFPGARFILTIRECRSWLDSIVNHVLANDVGPIWRQAQRTYYRVDQFTHQRGEEAFRDAGLYPVRAYLSAWGRHNRHLVEVVPPERLLVIRTSEIKNSSERIAAFLGVDPKSVDAERGHQYVNERKYHMLEKVDRSLLEESIHECCGDVMAKWFPVS